MLRTILLIFLLQCNFFGHSLHLFTSSLQNMGFKPRLFTQSSFLIHRLLLREYHTSRRCQISNENGGGLSINNRKIALHVELNRLGMDAEEIASAAILSMTSTFGYDIKFGKSAIRAYRSFVYPRIKDDKDDSTRNKTEEDILVAASRFARQIDFLAKRHRSHVTEWVRHTDIHEKRVTRFPLILVLDNIRSAFNVGSIFRTADACGVCLVITTGITPHPNGSGSEKVYKSALGADKVMPTRHFVTTRQALEYLRKFFPNVFQVGMETTDRSKIYTDVIYPGDATSSTNLVEHLTNRGFLDDESKVIDEPGTAIIFGNEVSGVDTELLQDLDCIAELPMFGVKNSLNVASCAPVVLYEILRQWKVR